MDEWLEKLDITLNTAVLQKATILVTVRIMRRVLEYYSKMTPREAWVWVLTLSLGI